MFIFFILLRCAIKKIVDPLIHYPFPTDKIKNEMKWKERKRNHHNNKDAVNFLIVLICLSYSMQTMHYITSTVRFSFYTHTHTPSPWSNLLVFQFIFMRCYIVLTQHANVCVSVCVVVCIFIFIMHMLGLVRFCVNIRQYVIW